MVVAKAHEAVGLDLDLDCVQGDGFCACQRGEFQPVLAGRVDVFGEHHMTAWQVGSELGAQLLQLLVFSDEGNVEGAGPRSAPSCSAGTTWGHLVCG